MDESTCYFCGMAPADPDRAVAVEAERQENVGLKRVSTEPVWIPRCAGCQRRHKRRQSLGAVTLVLVILAWITGTPLVLLGDHGQAIYLGTCVGVTVVNIVFWRWRDRASPVKSVYAAADADHPGLVQLRSQGFSLVVRR